MTFCSSCAGLSRASFNPIDESVGMKIRYGFVLLVSVLASSMLPASAQQQKSPAGVSPAVEMTEGEVRKVDNAGRKITLRHGEIKNLDMPAMTMVFQVKDAAMLDKLQVGDKVRFRAEKTGSAYTVTAIEQLK